MRRYVASGGALLLTIVANGRPKRDEYAEVTDLAPTTYTTYQCHVYAFNSTNTSAMLSSRQRHLPKVILSHAPLCGKRRSPAVNDRSERPHSDAVGTYLLSGISRRTQELITSYTD